MSWIYKGNQINSIKDIEDIEGYKPFGFIYNIVADNGREYIGMKQLVNTRRKRVSDKKVSQLGKSAFKRTKDKKSGQMKYYENISTESNWLNYTGSNKELNNDIKNGANITKYILKFVDRKAMMIYEETKEILCTGALENDRFYNDNALGRFYKKNIITKVKIK